MKEELAVHQREQHVQAVPAAVPGPMNLLGIERKGMSTLYFLVISLHILLAFVVLVYCVVYLVCVYFFVSAALYLVHVCYLHVV